MRVSGIIEEGSGSASGVKSDKSAWMMSVTLRPHRDEAGVLHDAELVLWRFCADTAGLKEVRRAVVAGTVVSVEVSAPADITAFGRARVPHERVFTTLDTAADPEMVAFAAANAPPTEVTIPGLGQFVYDARAHWYDAKPADGRAYTLTVRTEERRHPGPILAGATAVVAAFEAAWPAILAGVVAELYDLWEGGWRQDDDDELDAAAWSARLTLASVVWDADEPPDTYTVWLEDGDLFGGHGIEVRVAGGQVESADIVG